jgi:hypothetical protein
MSVLLIVGTRNEYGVDYNAANLYPTRSEIVPTYRLPRIHPVWKCIYRHVELNYSSVFAMGHDS